MEINISCPNVREGGVLFGNDPEMSRRVVAACRTQTAKPLVTKLSPNQTDIAENARRCIEAGTDGLAVANTFVGMAIDTRTRRPVLGENKGGLSGPAVKPMALYQVHQVHEVARRHGVPIIGQGGIASAEDALEFMIAGASAGRRGHRAVLRSAGVRAHQRRTCGLRARAQSRQRLPPRRHPGAQS